MPIKLSKNPIFEIRCPNNLGIITLLLQGIEPLQTWFPQATIRISVDQTHHHWLKRLVPNVQLSSENQKADYIITGKISGPWYQHRWQSLIQQFKPLGLRNLSEFKFPKGTPPTEINQKKTIITNDPDYAQWMALWDIPVIWQCNTKKHNPLHYGPLGIEHTLIHLNQTEIHTKTKLEYNKVNYFNEANAVWCQWGLTIGVIGPQKTIMTSQLKSVGYHVYSINNNFLLTNNINTLVFADDLMPLSWSLKLSWHNTKQKWFNKQPLYTIEANTLFEFEHQLALR